MAEPFSVVVERVLPYDGPHSADMVEAAASGLPALVRYLNNAPQDGGQGHMWNGQSTLRYAPTVDAVIGGVKSAAHLLDQLLRQLEDALERLADDETLYNDRPPGAPRGFPGGNRVRRDGRFGGCENPSARPRDGVGGRPKPYDAPGPRRARRG